MPNYTPHLRLTQPNAGETNWGDMVNRGVTALLEAAICGSSTIALTDADYTLSTHNGAADEARAMFLVFSGTLTAPRSVICPAVPKLYLVRNNSTQALHLKTASAAGVWLPAGKSSFVQCNGQAVESAFDYLPSLTQVHHQTTPATTWNLTHHLHKCPAVTITDLDGFEVEAAIRHLSLSELSISFSEPFAGTAYLT